MELITDYYRVYTNEPERCFKRPRVERSIRAVHIYQTPLIHTEIFSINSGPVWGYFWIAEQVTKSAAMRIVAVVPRLDFLMLVACYQQLTECRSTQSRCYYLEVPIGPCWEQATPPVMRLRPRVGHGVPAVSLEIPLHAG